MESVRVDIVIDVQSVGIRESHNLALNGIERFTDLEHGRTKFHLHYYLTDKQRLHTTDWWLCRTEDAFFAECLVQKTGHIRGKMVENSIVAMAQINVNEMIERRIAEHLALHHLG